MVDNIDKGDDVILSLLSVHDPAAARYLYRLHFKAVYNFTFKLIGDADSAKDICQELFVTIWERRARLKITKPIRRYLLAAVRNRILNYHRDRKKDVIALAEALDRSSMANHPVIPDAAVQAKELEKIIRLAINVLPNPARTTFLLSRKLGLTYREIAERLGVTEKAVEKNMSKALALLRIVLSNYL